MSAMMANFMQLLTYDFEPAKFVLRLNPIDIFLPNKMFQTGRANGLTKGFQFVSGAFGHQFDPPISQIADRAGDFESAGNRSGGITKPDTLHATRIKNLHPCAIHSTRAGNVPQLGASR